MGLFMYFIWLPFVFHIVFALPTLMLPDLFIQEWLRGKFDQQRGRSHKSSNPADIPSMQPTEVPKETLLLFRAREQRVQASEVKLG